MAELLWSDALSLDLPQIDETHRALRFRQLPLDPAQGGAERDA
jgi:hypothetical protein